MPDIAGRRIIVTGATGGLGFEIAQQLASAGAEVTVTARDATKGAALLDRLGHALPDKRFDLVLLDLADLNDVARAADECASRAKKLDVLINNAGIMLVPKSTTADGFELHMGTNHLGHFAWTARLLPLLADGGRVVTVSSVAHARAKSLDLATLSPGGSPAHYHRWRAYAQSKLANLLFADELARRVQRAGARLQSVAAHPGLAATELTQTGLAQSSPFVGWAFTKAIRPALQSIEAGAQPILRAAVDPDARNGDYFGPHRLGGIRGNAVRVAPSPLAQNQALACELWQASERAAHLTFPI